MSNAQNLGVSPTIQIGTIRLEGRAMLAPMSGVSDLAMRRIARRFGAALAFSEMVAAETFLHGDAEASVRADGVAVVRARDRAVELLEGRDENEGILDRETLASLVRGASVPFGPGLL